MQLKTTTPYLVGIPAIWLRFQVEKITKEIPVGLDPKKGFTKINKDRNVQNGIRIQMMDLNTIKRKKALKIVRGWKSKSALDEMLKNDKFINIRKALNHTRGLTTALHS